MQNLKGDAACLRTRALGVSALLLILASSSCASAGRGAAGDGWARTALASAIPVKTPFQEIVFFSPDEPWAAAYRVRLAGGEVLRARALPASVSHGTIHVELFEMRGPIAYRIARRSTSSAGPALELTAPRTGDFIVRVRPEIGLSGRYRIALDGGATTTPAAAAFAFPVAGRNARAIRSRFGASRDGGARTHEGVDIFAPRGTPVVASVSGVVSDVANTPRGGRVVWVDSDEQDVSLYYAHLEAQLVRVGMRVRAGDTLGRVGNTGNARNTAPHLHFGVYQHGSRAIDPEPFLSSFRFARAPSRPAGPDFNVKGLGSWIMTPPERTRLRDAPYDDARVLETLAPLTRARLVGGTSRWYRIALPDGVTGFIAVKRVDPEGL
jgi:murein DD-endopeptidase MepM/ murein hydrolase activator NlpD